MFLGHFGVGFGAKRFAPRASLGTLFLAAQFADLLWPVLLLAGLEHVQIDRDAPGVTPLDFVSYPISHSLTLLIVWGLVVGGTYWLVRRYLAGAIVVACAVVSHWILDLVVHRPDLPLTPAGGVKVGLGLWASLPATLVAEFLVFGGGFALYLGATTPTDRKGVILPWALVIVLAAIYVANLFGPPPPNSRAIAWTTNAMWLLVAFGYWVDRHRTARTASRTARLRPQRT